MSARGQNRELADRLYKLGQRRGRKLLASEKGPIPEAFGMPFGHLSESLVDPEDAIPIIRDTLPRFVDDTNLIRDGFISYRPTHETIFRSAGPCRTDDHDHGDHADYVMAAGCFNSEEFATILPSPDHQRRIATNHVGTSSTQTFSWSVPGMISPHTGQVMRCAWSADRPEETWGLYYQVLQEESQEPNPTRSKCYERSLNTDKRAARMSVPPFEASPPMIWHKSVHKWAAVVKSQGDKHSTQQKGGSRSPLKLGRWLRRPTAVKSQPGQDQIKDSARSQEYCTKLKDAMDQDSYGPQEMGCPRKYYMSSPQLKVEREYKLLLGDSSFLAVWLPAEVHSPSLECAAERLSDELRSSTWAAPKISECLKQFQKKWPFSWGSLTAFAYASRLFEEFPETTVALSVIEKPLHEAKWVGLPYSYALTEARGEIGLDQPLENLFACLAMFESGSLDLDPHDLEHVMAMAAGNNLFIADYVLCDPLHCSVAPDVQHTIGNIGKPGISFLKSVRYPDTIEPDLSAWRHVPYADFDGAFEDNFAETSLHLTLTGDEQPLGAGQVGYRDKQAFLVEAVARAYDRSRWVADLDLRRLSISELLRELRLPVIKVFEKCVHTETERGDYRDVQPLTAIDNWDELIDPPPNMGIVRAKGNWQGRRALVDFCTQKRRHVIVASEEEVCWTCLKAAGSTSNWTIIC